MMHSDLSLPGNLFLTKNFNIKMSGGLFEHFNIKMLKMNECYNINVKIWK